MPPRVPPRVPLHAAFTGATALLLPNEGSGGLAPDALATCDAVVYLQGPAGAPGGGLGAINTSCAAAIAMYAFSAWAVAWAVARGGCGAAPAETVRNAAAVGPCQKFVSPPKRAQRTRVAPGGGSAGGAVAGATGVAVAVVVKAASLGGSETETGVATGLLAIEVAERERVRAQRAATRLRKAGSERQHWGDAASTEAMGSMFGAPAGDGDY